MPFTPEAFNPLRVTHHELRLLNHICAYRGPIRRLGQESVANATREILTKIHYQLRLFGELLPKVGFRWRKPPRPILSSQPRYLTDSHPQHLPPFRQNSGNGSARCEGLVPTGSGQNRFLTRGQARKAQYRQHNWTSGNPPGFCHSGPERIQMNVTGQLQRIGIRLGQCALVPALKQVAGPLAFGVKVGGIGAVNMPHNLGQITCGGFQQEVLGVSDRSVATGSRFKIPEKPLQIAIVLRKTSLHSLTREVT